MNRSTRRQAERRNARETRAARRVPRGAALAAGATLALSGSTAWLATTAGSTDASVCGPNDVSSTADSGPGSLRAILAAANDGDTITFACVANQTITVSSPLTIGKFVTLDGAGQNVTISGGDTTQVLQLDHSKTGTGTVSIEGLTVTHGQSSGGSGANLRFYCGSTGIDLVLDGTTLSYGSPVAPTYSDGAGAYVLNCGTTTVTNSTFSHNTTRVLHTTGAPSSLTSGLMVWGSGNVTITDSTFDHNYYGNSILVWDSGNVTITGTDVTHTFQSNGVQISKSGDVSITGGSFADNTWIGSGAALYAGNNASITITDTTMSRNSAGDRGGAVYLYAMGPTNPVTITGSTFDHNSSHLGGAITLSSDVSAASITSSTFTHNLSSELTGQPSTARGGAIASQASDLTVSGSTFSENTGTSWGGAIFARGAAASVVVTGTDFSRNTSDHGGAIATDAIDTLFVEGSTFDGNQATDYGGAIIAFTSATSVVVANSTLTANTSRDGSAAYVSGTTPFSLLQSTVSGNYASTASGALAVYGAGATLISGSIVVGNDSKYGVLDLNGELAKNVASDDSLIGVASGVTLTGTSTTGVAVADLHLGALAANGGPTRTMALGVGSVAIDAGPSPVATFTGNSFDQRGTGFPRVSNGRVDVGAFEVQAPPPPPPTALIVTGPAPGSRTVSLSWTAPATGPTPDGYQIRCLPQGYPFDTGPGGKVVYVGSATTSVTVPGLTGGETYVCFVRARYGPQYFSWLGDGYEGPLSDPSTPFVVARTAPPVPVQVAASAPPQPSGQATSVSFVAPENRSGAPVTRYDARCTSSNGGTTRTGSGATSPVGVTNLTKGRTYTCVVSAVNSVGPSAWSAVSNRIVVPAGPATNVRASTPTAANRRTTVSFTPPDGGPAPARYWVECRTADGSSVLTGSGTSSPVTVTNLVRGKTYTCRVWAVFTGGATGPASAASNSIRVP